MATWDKHDSDALERRPVSKKNRASHVCQGCRRRKVKCDLVVSGSPCNNCRQDEIACVRLESKRCRRYRQQKRQLDEAVSSLSPSSSAHVSTQLTTNALSQPEESIDYPVNYNSTSQLSQIGRLPAYVKAFRPGFNSEDVAFLASRGALTMPEVGVRDELIRAFVLYVHPYMPVLDLQDFFDAIRQTDNFNPCSLILLQAVLFSGCTFVDMSVLETMGFQTRREARKAFYMKVKHLFEFDYETETVEVLQALLLLTSWFESPEDQKDPSYWLGVCHGLANRIDLVNHHKYPSNPPNTRRLLNRLWWICILRDRVVSIATRKPLQFREDNFNTPFLTLEDFEIQPIDAGTALLRDCAVLRDPAVRQTLARLCIEKTKLGILVAQILTQNYSPSSMSETPLSSGVLYSPNRPVSNLGENVGLRRNLQQWQKNLPDDCVFKEPSTYAQHRTIDEEVLFLHRAVLRIFSSMASGLLYRPLLSVRADPTLENHFPQLEVRREVAKVADEAGRMARIFFLQNLVQKLPSYSTTFFFSVLPTLIFCIKTPTKSLCGNPRLHFYWCAEAIFQQRDIWPTAHYAYAMAQTMISRAQLQDAGLIRETLSYSRESEPQLPNHGLSPDVVSHGGNNMAPPTASPSILNPNGNLTTIDALPDLTLGEVAWLDFDALFNQYFHSAETYPTS